jgi:hypothetical protein
MQPTQDQLAHVVRGARHLVETALGPWGGTAAACIDAYEAAIRSAAEAQVTVAHVVQVQPARSIVALCADLTRDLGAVQVSAARWILDV